MDFLKSLFGNNKKRTHDLTIPEGNNVELLTIKSKSKIVIGVPAIPPSQKLVDAIRLILAKYSDVNEAYIFLKKNLDSPADPILTLGLYIKEGILPDVLKQIMNNIFIAIQNNINKGDVMDIIILKDSDMLEKVKKYEESLIYKAGN